MPDDELTLGDAAYRYYYGISCPRCQHQADVDLPWLLEKLGPQFKVIDLRARMRCSRCGVRGGIICCLRWEHATSLLHKARPEWMAEGWPIRRK